MSTPFADVQRIVLQGSTWESAHHVVLGFGPGSHPLYFLSQLDQENLSPTASGPPAKELDFQVSLGFSRRGLEHARVPTHVLALFALKAPAFYTGAAVRASEHLGDSGGVPAAWKPAFGFTTLDAVLSLHGNDPRALEAALASVHRIADASRVQALELLPATRLPTPHGEERDEKAMWTHFGFRDGLSHVGIKGWTHQQHLDQWERVSVHEPGEFVLGYRQNSGANPWLAGPDMRVWPRELRDFFRDGSFGVLHQISQDVPGFESFVERCAAETQVPLPEIKAKLCGRFTNGRPLAAPEATHLEDFNYEKDPRGELCPFGSHIRRMNPRGEGLAHGIRTRPLLRRGLAYGTHDQEERGLMGQFFCASIEDQFEHLVGQWADRVPLGSEDAGGARDPMFGGHQEGDGPFVIPRNGARPLELKGLSSFTRTEGIAYLFYPSLSALRGIRENRPWRPDEDEVEA